MIRTKFPNYFKDQKRSWHQFGIIVYDIRDQHWKLIDWSFMKQAKFNIEVFEELQYGKAHNPTYRKQNDVNPRPTLCFKESTEIIEMFWHLVESKDVRCKIIKAPKDADCEYRVFINRSLETSINGFIG